jgi:hypothetical protein
MKNPQLMVAMAEVVSQLGVIGSGREDEETVVRAFSISHRTLQQCFMRVVIIPILRYLAKGECDLRNKASCVLATKMLAAVTEDDLYLPFV